MAKTIQNYQEAGHEIDSSHHVVFTCHPTARFAVYKEPWPSEQIKVTTYLTIGNQDGCVGIAEQTYASVEALLDAYQINDLYEIWEVLD